jgi:hypothetical protein
MCPNFIKNILLRNSQFDKEIYLASPSAFICLCFILFSAFRGIGKGKPIEEAIKLRANISTKKMVPFLGPKYTFFWPQFFFISLVAFPSSPRAKNVGESNQKLAANRILLQKPKSFCLGFGWID